MSEELREWNMTRNEAAQEKYDEMVAEIKAPLEERIEQLEARWEKLKSEVRFDMRLNGRETLIVLKIMTALEGE